MPPWGPGGHGAAPGSSSYPPLERPPQPFPAAGAGGGDQPRPFALTVSAVLTVTGGLQVAALVGFVWLVLHVGAATFSYDVPSEAPLFHLLDRGNLAMRQGLWLPLLGLPLAAAVLGFVLVARSWWPRVVVTVLGVVAVGWMLLWRSDMLVWVSIPAGYVTLCVLLLWTPGVTRWIRTRPDAQEPPR